MMTTFTIFIDKEGGLHVSQDNGPALFMTEAQMNETIGAARRKIAPNIVDPVEPENSVEIDDFDEPEAPTESSGHKI